MLHRVCGRGRRRNCAGVARNVARRSLTMRAGGIGGRAGSVVDAARHRATSSVAQLLGRAVDERVGGADRDRNDLALAEHPFRGAADDARRIAALSAGGSYAEMRVDDRRVVVGHGQRRERAAPPPPPAPPARRYRRRRARPGRRRSRAPATRSPAKSIAAQPRAEADLGAGLARADASAGSTRLSDRPSRGTSGRQAAAPRPSVSATTAPEQRAEPSSARGVQRRDRERLPQPAKQHACRGSSTSATVASAPARRSRSAAR